MDDSDRSNPLNVKISVKSIADRGSEKKKRKNEHFRKLYRSFIAEPKSRRFSRFFGQISIIRNKRDRNTRLELPGTRIKRDEITTSDLWLRRYTRSLLRCYATFVSFLTATRRSTTVFHFCILIVERRRIYQT